MANVGDDSVKLDININNKYILKIQEQLQNNNKTCEILKILIPNTQKTIM